MDQPGCCPARDGACCTLLKPAAVLAPDQQAPVMTDCAVVAHLEANGLLVLVTAHRLHAAEAMTSCSTPVMTYMVPESPESHG